MLSLNQLPQAVHQEESGANRPARFITFFFFFFAALLCMAVFFIFLEEELIASSKKLRGQMEEQSETPLLINVDTQIWQCDAKLIKYI